MSVPFPDRWEVPTSWETYRKPLTGSIGKVFSYRRVALRGYSPCLPGSRDEERLREE